MNDIHERSACLKSGTHKSTKNKNKYSETFRPRLLVYNKYTLNNYKINRDTYIGSFEKCCTINMVNLRLNMSINKKTNCKTSMLEN